MVNPQTAGVRAETPASAPEDRTRLVLLGLVTLLFLALSVWVATPLLPALTWGMALAIVAWPLHVWMVRHVKWPGLAAGLTAAAVAILIAVSGIFVTYQLAREAASQADQMREESAAGVLRAAMTKTPGLRGVVDWMDRTHLDLDHALRKFIASYTEDASSL